MSAMRAFVLIVSAALVIGPTLAETTESVNAMKWHKRVVLAASPVAGDANLTAQQHILEAWGSESAARDIAFVAVQGDHVAGASDSAAALRQRYRLKGRGFRVVLIGKDGRVALGSDKPIAAAALQSVIDAMPMRQAGER